MSKAAWKEQRRARRDARQSAAHTRHLCREDARAMAATYPPLAGLADLPDLDAVIAETCSGPAIWWERRIFVTQQLIKAPWVEELAEPRARLQARLFVGRPA